MFRLKGEITSIAQVLTISNIAGKELEFWLCNNRNKIIVLSLRRRPTQCSPSLSNRTTPRKQSWNLK